MIRSPSTRLDSAMTRVCDPSEIPDEGFLVRAVGGRNVALSPRPVGVVAVVALQHLPLVRDVRDQAAGARAGDALPAVILLTDGLPSEVPTPAPRGTQEDTVLAAATAL